jgi:hypothetical protein
MLCQGPLVISLWYQHLILSAKATQLEVQLQATAVLADSNVRIILGRHQLRINYGPRTPPDANKRVADSTPVAF